MQFGSVQTKILALLIIPVVALMATTALVVADALRLRTAASEATSLIQAATTATDLLDALQLEMLVSVASMNEDGSVGTDQVETSRRVTDTRADLLAAESEGTVAGAMVEQIAGDGEVLVGLPDLREAVDNRAFDGGESEVSQRYALLADGLQGRLSEATGTVDTDSIVNALAITSAVTNVRQAVAEHSTTILVALDGGIDASTLGRRLPTTQTEADVWLNQYMRLTSQDGGDPVVAAVSEIESLNGNSVRLAIDNESLGSAADVAGRFAETLGQVRVPADVDLVGLTADLNGDATARLWGAGVLALLTLLLAGGVPLLLNRNVFKPLKTLTRYADSVRAGLPEAVERAREGEDMALDTPLSATLRRRDDEFGRLTNAVHSAASEAVSMAVEQTRIRLGVSATIIDVARREQAQVSRVLGLLDQLEAQESDPDRLMNLYKVDNLATGLRRQAENLLVLAGQDPLDNDHDGPVVLGDVLLGAASEIELYSRVDLGVMPDIQINGWAADALAHMVSELLDNATNYSPPSTQVEVSAKIVDGHLRLGIRDQGLGMAAESISLAQSRLEAPPLLDAAESSQLGLYVVGLLARRLGVDVRLSTPESGRGLCVNIDVPPGLLHGKLQTPPPPGASWPIPALQLAGSGEATLAPAGALIGRQTVSVGQSIRSTPQESGDWYSGLGLDDLADSAPTVAVPLPTRTRRSNPEPEPTTSMLSMTGGNPGTNGGPDPDRARNDTQVTHDDTEVTRDPADFASALRELAAAQEEVE